MASFGGMQKGSPTSVTEQAHFEELLELVEDTDDSLCGPGDVEMRRKARSLEDDDNEAVRRVQQAAERCSLESTVGKRRPSGDRSPSLSLGPPTEPVASYDPPSPGNSTLTWQPVNKTTTLILLQAFSTWSIATARAPRAARGGARPPPPDGKRHTLRARHFYASKKHATMSNLRRKFRASLDDDERSSSDERSPLDVRLRDRFAEFVDQTSHRRLFQTPQELTTALRLQLLRALAGARPLS